jgi:hypothetical protein
LHDASRLILAVSTIVLPDRWGHRDSDWPKGVRFVTWVELPHALDGPLCGLRVIWSVGGHRFETRAAVRLSRVGGSHMSLEYQCSNTEHFQNLKKVEE